MTTASDATSHGVAAPEQARRDFLYLVTGTTAAVGTAALVWPLIDSMNPAADTLALATSEVDLAGMDVGQRITVKWRGKPVFINYRSPEEIAAAEAGDANPDLIDPAADDARVQRKQWLVVIGICTHLGCVPQGQAPGTQRGPYGGYFCACHGSVYDSAGRVRRGPAPRNLDVPSYVFVDDTRVRIG